MPKFLVRVVSFLLIPCFILSSVEGLVADPMTASAFSLSLIPDRERVGLKGQQRTDFQLEALAPISRYFHTVISGVLSPTGWKRFFANTTRPPTAPTPAAAPTGSGSRQTMPIRTGRPGHPLRAIRYDDLWEAAHDPIKARTLDLKLFPPRLVPKKDLGSIMDLYKHLKTTDRNRQERTRTHLRVLYYLRQVLVEQNRLVYGLTSGNLAAMGQLQDPRLGFNFKREIHHFLAAADTIPTIEPENASQLRWTLEYSGRKSLGDKGEPMQFMIQPEQEALHLWEVFHPENDNLKKALMTKTDAQHAEHDKTLVGVFWNEALRNLAEYQGVPKAELEKVIKKKAPHLTIEIRSSHDFWGEHDHHGRERGHQTIILDRESLKHTPILRAILIEEADHVLTGRGDEHSFPASLDALSRHIGVHATINLLKQMLVPLGMFGQVTEVIDAAHQLGRYKLHGGTLFNVMYLHNLPLYKSLVHSIAETILNIKGTAKDYKGRQRRTFPIPTPSPGRSPPDYDWLQAEVSPVLTTEGMLMDGVKIPDMEGWYWDLRGGLPTFTPDGLEMLAVTFNEHGDHRGNQTLLSLLLDPITEKCGKTAIVASNSWSAFDDWDADPVWGAPTQSPDNTLWLLFKQIKRGWHDIRSVHYDRITGHSFLTHGFILQDGDLIPGIPEAMLFIRGAPIPMPDGQEILMKARVWWLDPTKIPHGYAYSLLSFDRSPATDRLRDARILANYFEGYKGPRLGFVGPAYHGKDLIVGLQEGGAPERVVYVARDPRSGKIERLTDLFAVGAALHKDGRTYILGGAAFGDTHAAFRPGHNELWVRTLGGEILALSNPPLRPIETISDSATKPEPEPKQPIEEPFDKPARPQVKPLHVRKREALEARRPKDVHALRGRALRFLALGHPEKASALLQNKYSQILQMQAGGVDRAHEGDVAVWVDQNRQPAIRVGVFSGSDTEASQAAEMIVIKRSEDYRKMKNAWLAKINKLADSAQGEVNSAGQRAVVSVRAGLREAEDLGVEFYDLFADLYKKEPPTLADIKQALGGMSPEDQDLKDALVRLLTLALIDPKSSTAPPAAAPDSKKGGGSASLVWLILDRLGYAGNYWAKGLGIGWTFIEVWAIIQIVLPFFSPLHTVTILLAFATAHAPLILTGGKHRARDALVPFWIFSLYFLLPHLASALGFDPPILKHFPFHLSLLQPIAALPLSRILAMTVHVVSDYRAIFTRNLWEERIKESDRLFEKYQDSYTTNWTPGSLIPKLSHRGRPKFLEKYEEHILHAVLEGLSWVAIGHPLPLLAPAARGLYNILLRTLISRFAREIDPRKADELISRSMERIEGAGSLEEQRSLSRGYFRRSGYLLADYIVREFSQSPFDESSRSTIERIGQRERLIQRLASSFHGVMWWKGKPSTERKDREILNILIRLLSDPDPWVIKAAVRGIGLVAPYLDEVSREDVLERYYEILRRHPSEVARGSVARGLREVFSARSISVVHAMLEEGQQSPWVQAYLVEALGFLVERYPLDSMNYTRFFDLVSLLLRNAKNKETIIALRTSSLKALAWLGHVDDETMGEVSKLLLDKNSPDPTVQETALWTLSRLALESRSPERVDSFLKTGREYLSQVRGEERRNPFLEAYTLKLLRRHAILSSSQPLRNQVRRLKLAPISKQKNRNPVVFIDIEPLIEGGSTELERSLSAEAVSALQRVLHQQGCAVVMADSFLEDRDTAVLDDPEHPQIKLRTDMLARSLQNLATNWPARVPSRDPVRAKHAKRMERVVVPPAPGMPVVVLGFREDSAALAGAWQTSYGPISALSLADYPETASKTYGRLIQQLRLFAKTAAAPPASQPTAVPLEEEPLIDQDVINDVLARYAQAIQGHEETARAILTRARQDDRFDAVNALREAIPTVTPDQAEAMVQEARVKAHGMVRRTGKDGQEDRGSIKRGRGGRPRAPFKAWGRRSRSAAEKKGPPPAADAASAPAVSRQTVEGSVYNRLTADQQRPLRLAVQRFGPGLPAGQEQAREILARYATGLLRQEEALLTLITRHLMRQDEAERSLTATTARWDPQHEIEWDDWQWDPLQPLQLRRRTDISRQARFNRNTTYWEEVVPAVVASESPSNFSAITRADAIEGITKGHVRKEHIMQYGPIQVLQEQPFLCEYNGRPAQLWFFYHTNDWNIRFALYQANLPATDRWDVWAISYPTLNLDIGSLNEKLNPLGITVLSGPPPAAAPAGMAFLEQLKHGSDFEHPQWVAGTLSNQTSRDLHAGKDVPFILHVGSSFGYELAAAAALRARRGKPAILIGIDGIYNQPSLVAETLSKLKGLEDIILVYGGFQNLPSTFKFHEVRIMDWGPIPPEDVRKWISRFASLVRDGGRLLYVATKGEWDPEIARRFEAEGFEVHVGSLHQRDKNLPADVKGEVEILARGTMSEHETLHASVRLIVALATKKKIGTPAPDAAPKKPKSPFNPNEMQMAIFGIHGLFAKLRYVFTQPGGIVFDAAHWLIKQLRLPSRPPAAAPDKSGHHHALVPLFMLGGWSAQGGFSSPTHPVLLLFALLAVEYLIPWISKHLKTSWRDYSRFLIRAA